MYTEKDFARDFDWYTGRTKEKRELNTLFCWGTGRRKWVMGAIVLSLGVSLCYLERRGYAETITAVESQKTPELQETEEVSAQISQAVETPAPTPVVIPNTLVVTKKKCRYPKKIYEGQAFVIRGTLRSNHQIKEVAASIVATDGKQVCSVTKRGQGTKFDLHKIDEEMKFSELDAGTYTYEVAVTDSYGNNRTAIKKDFTVKKSKWMWPVANSTLGDGFHCGCSAHGGRHYGVDIKGVEKGTNIHAIREGEVVYAQYHRGTSKASFGKLVILYHGNGIYSYYAHCNAIKVKAGDKVLQGDVIATVGQTGRCFGTHLHLELRKGPDFRGKYNHYKFLDKYRYKQFNPMKKNYLKYIG